MENVVLTVPDGRSLSSRANRININELQVNTIIYSTEDVTAAGSVRADATPISEQYVFVTVPVNLNGVYLPDPATDLVGRSFNIFNQSAVNTLNIYPFGPTETIAGLPAGSPYVLDPSKSVSLINTSLTTWEIIDLSEIPGIIIGANGNNFYGSNAGNTTVTGADNTGIGNLSMNLITSGNRNTALGSRALRNILTGSDNIAVGYQALAALTSGSNLIAIGSNALAANTTGVFNLALGSSSLTTNTVGNYNTAIGYQSLMSNLNGNRNIGIGYQALMNNLNGIDNLAIGYLSLSTNIGGNYNIALGSESLLDNTNGNRNIGIGYQALTNNTIGTDNIAIGYLTLVANTTGSNLIAIGSNTLFANTTGIFNLALGSSSLTTNTVGSRNIGIGYQTLMSNLNGADNLAIGYLSLRTNTSGNYNIGLGSESLLDNTNGTRNIGIGYQALTNNTIGTDNVAIGYLSLSTNVGGGFNIGIGTNSLLSNINGTDNIAIGVGAIMDNVAGVGNLAMGTDALASTTGSGNLAFGSSALTALTTGNNNLAIGNSSLSVLTTGSGNIAIGSSAGSALTLADSNNILIGHVGVTGDTSITRIGTVQTKVFMAGMRGVTTDVADGIPLYISSTGQIGTGGASTTFVSAMSAFGATPNANGATITGANLQLQPASAAFPGGITTSAQSLAGVKTFTNGVAFAAFTSILNAYSAADVVITWSGAVTPVPANVLFERIGNMVYMSVDAIIDAKAVAGAGSTLNGNGAVPAEFIPAGDSWGIAMVFFAAAPFAAPNQEFALGIFRVTNTGGINVGGGVNTNVDTILPFLNAGGGIYNGLAKQVLAYSLV